MKRTANEEKGFDYDAAEAHYFSMSHEQLVQQCMNGLRAVHAITEAITAERAARAKALAALHKEDCDG